MAESTAFDAAIDRLLKDAVCAGFIPIDGGVAAIRCRAPLFSGLGPSLVKCLARRYPPEGWRAGETFVSNDPYEGGLRIDVVTVASPVIVGGSAVGAAIVACQFDDIGAMADSAFTYRREIRHEGFRLSMLRISTAEPPALLSAMLKANVRTPEAAFTTLRRQMEQARSLAALAAGRLMAPAPSAGFEQALARLPEKPSRGSALLPAQAGEGQVHAQFARSGGRLHVRLTLEATRVAADAAAPLAALQAAALSAISEVVSSAPRVISPLLDVEAAEGSLLGARYPQAVRHGSFTVYACYRAVLDALGAGGEARSYASFAGI